MNNKGNIQRIKISSDLKQINMKNYYTNESLDEDYDIPLRQSSQHI